MTDEVVLVARRMALNALAREVADALDRAGIPALLLKGPVTAVWLYGDRHARSYRDVDLLVHPDDFRRATAGVADLGFADLHRASLAYYESENEITFVRSSLALDLHWSIVGIPVPRIGEAVSAIFAASEQLDLAGTSFRVMSAPFRTAHLAWHVAQGQHDERALADLDRGLAVLTPDDWAAGAEAAREVGALDAFIAGLGVRPEGAAIVRQLDVHAPRRLEVDLRMADASHDARALLRLWRSPDRGRELRRALHVGREGLGDGERPPLARRVQIRAIAVARVAPACWELARSRRRLTRAERAS